MEEKVQKAKRFLGWIGAAMVLVLLWSGLPGLGAPLTAAAQQQYGVDFLTGVSFFDQNHQPIADGDTIPFGVSFQVRYTWALPDGVLQDGDTMAWWLPKQFMLTNDLSFVLYAGDPQDQVIAGTVLVQSSRNAQNEVAPLVTVRFNDYVQSRQNVQGELCFDIRWSWSYVTSETTVPIEMQIEGETIRFEFESGPVNPDWRPEFVKENVVGLPTEYINNERVIEWRLYLNFPEDDWHGTYVEDEIGSNQVLHGKPKLFYVDFQPKVPGPGMDAIYTAWTEAETDAVLTIEPSRRRFALDLGERLDGRAMLVRYATITTNQNGSERYKNKVHLARVNQQICPQEVWSFTSDGSGSVNGNTNPPPATLVPAITPVPVVTPMPPPLIIITPTPAIITPTPVVTPTPERPTATPPEVTSTPPITPTPAAVTPSPTSFPPEVAVTPAPPGPGMPEPTAPAIILPKTGQQEATALMAVMALCGMSAAIFAAIYAAKALANSGAARRGHRGRRFK